MGGVSAYYAIAERYKGAIFINGFNLGRYWEIGPQRTLYLPGPLLKPGENSIVIFELEKVDSGVISMIAAPLLGVPSET